jgi:glycerol-3-phosphate responsive antiterminator
MAQMSISTIEMFLIQEGLEDGIVSHKDSMYDEHRKNGIILQNIADSVANN